MKNLLTWWRPIENRIARHWRRDEGASAVEYGLLVALIAVVIAGTVVALGTTLKDKFDQASCTVARSSTSDSCGTGTGNDAPGNAGPGDSGPGNGSSR